ncbi:putative integral membrane protein [Acanthocheilonema viteae]
MYFDALITSRFFPKNCKKYLCWLSLLLQLSVATVLHLALSAIIFQPSHIGYFEKFLCYEKECMKLRKMYELWPPHRHAVLYLIFSAFAHCTVRYCLHATATARSVSKNEEKNELQPSYRKYLHSFILSTLIFMLTLHVQRISEFHFVIIILNYVHTLLAGAIVTFMCV